MSSPCNSTPEDYDLEGDPVVIERQVLVDSEPAPVEATRLHFWDLIQLNFQEVISMDAQRDQTETYPAARLILRLNTFLDWIFGGFAPVVADGRVMADELDKLVTEFQLADLGQLRAWMVDRLLPLAEQLLIIRGFRSLRG